MKQPIPIENIYYLFCYAWNRFPEARTIEVGKTESPKIWDLFASVLVRGVNRLMRRGLDRGYAEIQQDTSTIRGRIVVGDTLRRNLLMFGQANCRFDELRHDILHNQIIKATLRRLSNSDELDPGLRHELRKLVHLFFEVTDISLSSTHFRRVQLSRNNGYYDLLLRICELVHTALLPNPNGKGSKFLDVLTNDKIMPSVFEAFIRNFFKSEQNEYFVGSEHIQWDAQAINIESDKYLPEMRTDVTLRSKNRTIIIDAKYYPEALVEYFGQKKIRSDHLYQLFAYLKNCKTRPSGGLPPEGILLYPATSRSIDLSYIVGGQKIRVKTLQLNQPWREIHKELVKMIALPGAENSKGFASVLSG